MLAAAGSKIGLAGKFQVAASTSRSHVAKVPILGAIVEKVIHVSYVCKRLFAEFMGFVLT